MKQVTRDLYGLPLSSNSQAETQINDFWKNAAIIISDGIISGSKWLLLIIWFFVKEFLELKSQIIPKRMDNLPINNYKHFLLPFATNMLKRGEKTFQILQTKERHIRERGELLFSEILNLASKYSIYFKQKISQELTQKLIKFLIENLQENLSNISNNNKRNISNTIRNLSSKDSQKPELGISRIEIYFEQFLNLKKFFTKKEKNEILISLIKIFTYKKTSLCSNFNLLINMCHYRINSQSKETVFKFIQKLLEQILTSDLARRSKSLFLSLLFYLLMKVSLKELEFAYLSNYCQKIATETAINWQNHNFVSKLFGEEWLIRYLGEEGEESAIFIIIQSLNLALDCFLSRIEYETSLAKNSEPVLFSTFQMKKEVLDLFSRALSTSKLLVVLF